MQKDPYKDVLFGVAVGDALGVPVEFESRETIARNPVTDMRGYGTYNLKPGTWSDETIGQLREVFLMLEWQLKPPLIDS
jgi:ADP-ribosyl-[dinitrogen reductase] hydrolase